MSLDRSLKSANALIRHRNVLTRAERLDKLMEDEKWNEGKSPLGLPKVGHRKQTLAKVAKEETAEGVVAPGAAAPAGAAAGAKGAPAAGAKGAPAAGAAKGAPAAGAKAAPAAKAAAPAKKK